MDSCVGAWGRCGNASSVYECTGGGTCEGWCGDAALSIPLHGREAESARQARCVDCDGGGSGASGCESGSGFTAASGRKTMGGPMNSEGGGERKVKEGRRVVFFGFPLHPPKQP